MTRRLTRLFVPAVNASIGVLVAAAAVACNVHHVSVIHEVRREREAAELEELKRHPAVAALLAEFPDAKVAEVRALLTPPENEESATG